jgi:hypothetical protein
MVEGETAGDPMSEQKWQRSSLRSLQQKMEQAGHVVSHTTIERLLREQGYSLKANEKRLSGAAHPDREPQFGYINQMKAEYLAARAPVISVDSKKKERIGNFKNNGREWCREAAAVNEHDFDQDAIGKAVPYGIYDLAHHLGYVYVGQSSDTPQFAVEMIARWWNEAGQRLFPNQSRLLILADAGGSNGCRPYLWKQQIQEQLANRLGLEVTVCHYPTGASKWNPIEHRSLARSASIGRENRCLLSRRCSPSSGVRSMPPGYKSRLFWWIRCMKRVFALLKKLWRLSTCNIMRFVHAGTIPSALNCSVRELGG